MEAFPSLFFSPLEPRQLGGVQPGLFPPVALGEGAEEGAEEGGAFPALPPRPRIAATFPVLVSRSECPPPAPCQGTCQPPSRDSSSFKNLCMGWVLNQLQRSHPVLAGAGEGEGGPQLCPPAPTPVLQLGTKVKAAGCGRR